MRIHLLHRLLCILVTALLCEGCFTHHWTEAQRQAFAHRCALTDTIPNLTLSLTGFSYDEVADVKVLRIHEGRVVNSFHIHADRTSFDSSRTRYWATIDRTLHIPDTYLFLILGQHPFVLSHMKMVMWAQFTMLSEGYGCVMGDYMIDSVRHEQDANPDLVKGFRHRP